MGTLFVIDYVYFELLITHIAAAEMKKEANNWIQKHFKRFETIKHLRPCRGLKYFLYCTFSEATQFMMYKLMAKGRGAYSGATLVNFFSQMRR